MYPNVWTNQSLPVASGNTMTISTPPPPSANIIIPETPQSSQDGCEASNEAEIAPAKGVIYTQSSVSLPDFYTSPIVVPPRITPISSTTASSSSPEPIEPLKKTKYIWK